ncbi:MAG: transketolase, partial [Candidatus Marinimicrobia bacterium]|nr:transketolase [Candidatus Neomarinimicrobiota bacterium]
MNNTKLKELKYFATNCREDIIRMSALGGCFIGASLSCVDMIVYLYNEYFNIVDTGIASDHRDYFILSKGHDVPALYSVLARLNIIDFDRLKNHCKLNDQIYWHPNTSIPGIEFHSGSLGHGLSVGMGITYFHKINE